MQTLRRALIFTHRYLGIPLSVLFVLWFVTGIAMIYVGGMPTLSAQARLEHLPALDLAAVRYHARRGRRGSGERLRPRRADDGARSPGVSVREPVRRRHGVRRHRRAPRRDRRRDRPRRRREVLEAARERRSSSSAPSSVPINGRCRPVATCRSTNSMSTTATAPRCMSRRGPAKYASSRRRRRARWRGSRRFRIGSTSRRCAANQPLWYWTVVGTSALGCLLALLGLVLGVTQFHKSTPFRWSTAVRYQGWMRWHYISGVVLRHLRVDLGLQRPACRWSRSTGRTPTASRSRATR